MKRLLVAAAILAFTIPLGHASDDALVVKSSRSSVFETVEKLTAAIEQAGAKVFATVDHAAGAKTVGSNLEPTVLVIFGNPRIGTPIIEADRRAGLDLPVRVLIWEEDGATRIGYENPQSLKARFGIEGAEESFAAMSDALEKLTAAASQ